MAIFNALSNRANFDTMEKGICMFNNYTSFKELLDSARVHTGAFYVSYKRLIYSIFAKDCFGTS